MTPTVVFWILLGSLNDPGTPRSSRVRAGDVRQARWRWTLWGCGPRSGTGEQGFEASSWLEPSPSMTMVEPGIDPGTLLLSSDLGISSYRRVPPRPHVATWDGNLRRNPPAAEFGRQTLDWCPRVAIG